MAFDKTQPTDTTKIRNLGVVIRPNWQAIAEADSTFQPWALNLIDRTGAAIVPTDPAAISTSYILYSKQDSGGNKELFGISPAGNILQLTKGAASAGANGETCLPGGILIKWGSATKTGSSTVTFASVGLTNFPNNCFAVLAQPINSNLPTVANDYVYTHTPTTSQFGVVCTRRITLASNTVSFYFVAIGN